MAATLGLLVDGGVLGVLWAWGVAYPHANDTRDQGKKGNVFYEQVSEVTSHQFLHILALGGFTVKRLHRVCIQEVRVTGAHLGGWLPQLAIWNLLLDYLQKHRFTYRHTNRQFYLRVGKVSVDVF